MMASTFAFDVEALLGLFTDGEIEGDDPAVRFQGTRETVDSVKCGGCNWTTGRLYVNADSKSEAESLLRSGDAGMCGECYAAYLSDVPPKVDVVPKSSDTPATTMEIAQEVVQPTNALEAGHEPQRTSQTAKRENWR